jgi:hypothetical protein
MTILAPERPEWATETDPRMSVVDRSVDVEKEVNQMTTATATDPRATALRTSSSTAHTQYHPRPSRFDRAVMRLSVAMLRWAEQHANRADSPWEERVLRQRNAMEREARESASPLGPLRLL